MIYNRSSIIPGSKGIPQIKRRSSVFSGGKYDVNSSDLNLNLKRPFGILSSRYR